MENNKDDMAVMLTLKETRNRKWEEFHTEVKDLGDADTFVGGTFADVVRKSREAAGLSVYDVAAIMGLHVRTIRRAERDGYANLTIRGFQTYRACFGWTPEETVEALEAALCENEMNNKYTNKHNVVRK